MIGLLLLGGCSGTTATESLPITFPDGTRAELSYPPELGLAELDVVPYSSGELRGGAAARDFSIVRGDVDAVLASSKGKYLGFQFGGWAVLVYDYRGAAAMTAAERAAWTANLSGHETADGFLRLEGGGPLRLARAGEHAGPELSFGSVGRPPWFALSPGPCRREPSRTRGFGSWCLSPSLSIHALGGRDFIEALARGLRART